jgi:hypothetical protein
VSTKAPPRKPYRALKRQRCRKTPASSSGNSKLVEGRVGPKCQTVFLGRSLSSGGLTKRHVSLQHREATMDHFWLSIVEVRIIMPSVFMVGCLLPCE